MCCIIQFAALTGMQRDHGESTVLGFGPDTTPNYAAPTFGSCIGREKEGRYYTPVRMEPGNDAVYTADYTGMSGL